MKLELESGAMDKNVSLDNYDLACIFFFLTGYIEYAYYTLRQIWKCI